MQVTQRLEVDKTGRSFLPGRLVARVTAFCVLCCVMLSQAHAFKLSNEFEVHLVPAVSTTWQTVQLQNTYASAIPVCTYHLPSFDPSDPPAVTRIDNITATSFDLKIQGWENGPATASDVHCIIAEKGAHKLPDGRLFEANFVESDKTSGQFTSDGAWSQAILENISTSIVHTYVSPVLLGQVISYNDPRASVFHNTDCDARGNPAFLSGQGDGACVGKHIGMIDDLRDPEDIGYIIAEAGSGTVNNIFYELAIGPNTISGSGNPTNSYTLARDHNVAVLSQGGENGGNGSWAVLYGPDPLPANLMKLQVDEEVFAGDVTRRHTNEQVFYWAFAAAELTLVKKLINDDGGTAQLSDFTLIAVGPDTISGTSGDPSITEAPVHPGVYTLSETTMPGYVASAWSCSGGSLSGNQIKLGGGDKAECVIANDDSSKAVLTLVKKVDNAAGGGTAEPSDFTLFYDDGSGTAGSGVTGSAAVTSVVLPEGFYKLGESSVNGYLLTKIICDGTDADGLDGLTLKNGEDVTCVFVNDDLNVDLSIVKKVSDQAPNIGDVLTFSIIIENLGPDTATDINVTDIVKDGFSYQLASIAGGSTRSDSDPTGSGLQWTIASLASGAQTTLTFDAVVNAP